MDSAVPLGRIKQGYRFTAKCPTQGGNRHCNIDSISVVLFQIRNAETMDPRIYHNNKLSYMCQPNHQLPHICKENTYSLICVIPTRQEKRPPSVTTIDYSPEIYNGENG